VISPSRHASPAFGLTRISYSSKKIKAELSSFYCAARTFEMMPEEEKGKPAIYAKDENGNPYAPSWTIFNLSAELDIWKSLKLSTGIENIGDKRYRPYSSGIVASGRNFTLGLKASF
jgi:hemoglobin/transferrin/lactoferrin receptor protein